MSQTTTETTNPWTASGLSTLRWAGRHKGLAAGAAILFSIIMVAVLAPLITWHDPYTQDILNRRVPPFWSPWFGGPPGQSEFLIGTDNLGRDYWSRLAYGSRISLIVGFASALLAGTIGAVIGVCAGYWGGRVDLVANFMIQTRLAVPVLLVAIAAVGIFGGSIQLIILIAGLALWDRAAVVTRASTQQIRRRDYITAAQALGCSNLRIILTEVLPALLTPLIVIVSIEMGQAVLFEAALSFLGLGVPPPEPSWGLMLAEGKEDIFFEPWLITMPGLALFLLVLSTSLIGNGLQRDRSRPTA